MSNGRGSLLERMYAKGLRMTHQRRLLAELLDATGGRPDADEVYRRALRRDPQIHRATVYRTLQTLRKLGLVAAVDAPRVRALDVKLRCTHCGGVQDPRPALGTELRERVRRENGFEPGDGPLEIAGECAPCRSR